MRISHSYLPLLNISSSMGYSRSKSITFAISNNKCFPNKFVTIKVIRYQSIRLYGKSHNSPLLLQTPPLTNHLMTTQVSLHHNWKSHLLSRLRTSLVRAQMASWKWFWLATHMYLTILGCGSCCCILHRVYTSFFHLDLHHGGNTFMMPARVLALDGSFQ